MSQLFTISTILGGNNDVGLSTATVQPPAQTPVQTPTLNDARNLLVQELNKGWPTSRQWNMQNNTRVTGIVNAMLNIWKFKRDLVLSTIIWVVDSYLNTSAGPITPWREGINCLDICNTRVLVAATGYDYSYAWLLLRDLAMVDITLYQRYRPYLSWVDVVEINAKQCYQTVTQLLNTHQGATNTPAGANPPTHPSIHFMVHPRAVYIHNHTAYENPEWLHYYTTLITMRIETLILSGNPACLIAAYMLRPHTVESYLSGVSVGTGTSTDSGYPFWMFINMRWVSWRVAGSIGQQQPYSLAIYYDYRDAFNPIFARNTIGGNLYDAVAKKYQASYLDKFTQ